VSDGGQYIYLLPTYFESGDTTVKVSDVTDVKKVVQKLMKKMFKGRVNEFMVGSSSLSNYRWYTVVRVSFTDGTIGLWRVVISATNGKVISFEPIKQGGQRPSHPPRTRRPTARR
jgi:hypothetical protein